MEDNKNSDWWVLIIKSWMTLDLYGGNDDGPSDFCHLFSGYVALQGLRAEFLDSNWLRARWSAWFKFLSLSGAPHPMICPCKRGIMIYFLLQFKALRAIPSWAVCGTDSKVSHFSSHHLAVLTPSQALFKEHSLETIFYANIQLRVCPQRSRPKIKNKIKSTSNEWWE